MAADGRGLGVVALGDGVGLGHLPAALEVVQAGGAVVVVGTGVGGRVAVLVQVLQHGAHPPDRRPLLGSVPAKLHQVVQVVCVGLARPARRGQSLRPARQDVL